ncbi:MAG TPA: hypothetical protein VHU14_06645 [Solirubrobacterales bacterium]|nr:hypothetical protein [Solirubrobacterales bacterium]
MQFPTSQDRPDVDLSDAEVEEHFRAGEEMRLEEREAEAWRTFVGTRVRQHGPCHRRAPRPAGSRRRG